MFSKPSKKFTLLKIACPLILFPFLSVIAFAQVGNLEGEVRDVDTQNPIEDVAIILEQDTTWTDQDGYYQFIDIPTGIYDVTAEKYGYATERETVEITTGITTEQDFFLSTISIIVIDISSIDLTLASGQTHQETFNIANVGQRNLTYNIDFYYEGMELDILLVDDDGGSNNHGIYTDVQHYYTSALDSAGLTYDMYVTDWTITPESPGPSSAQMAVYDLVIWFCGECWGANGDDTITPEDEHNLGVYLSGGGALFFSSQDYFYASYNGFSSFSPGQFPYDFLGVITLDQDQWTTPLNCVGGSGTIADSMSFTIQTPYSGSNLWTDMVAGRGDPLFLIDGQGAALQFDANSFRTVFTTLSFEALVDGASPSTRAQFMSNLEFWARGEFRDNTHHTHPPSTRSYQPPKTDDPWLVCSPEIGNINPGESQLITVTFDMPDTAEINDYYEGSLLINNNSLAGPVEIPVMVWIFDGTDDNAPSAPNDFSLCQNYPNPFNPITNIRFDLPHSSHINLTIYNLLGQEVITLIDQEMTSGTHQVIFDGSSLSSGIYFYRIQTTNFTDIRKMVLIK